MIAVVQTFGDDLTWHPHVHALVNRGGWDTSDAWAPVPFVDGEAAALVFRHRVFSFLRAQGLLSEERARLLLSWRHSGFSCAQHGYRLPGESPGGRRSHRPERSARAFS